MSEYVCSSYDRTLFYAFRRLVNHSLTLIAIRYYGHIASAIGNNDANIRDAAGVDGACFAFVFKK